MTRWTRPTYNSSSPVVERLQTLFGSRMRGKNNTLVNITVADTGIGMEEEVRVRLFEKGLRHSTKGTGTTVTLALP